MPENMRNSIGIIKLLLLLLYINIALFCKYVTPLKHHLVLSDDLRSTVVVSSFSYSVDGRLDVIVRNLTLSPDPTEFEERPVFGFLLLKTSVQVYNAQYGPTGYRGPSLCSMWEMTSRESKDFMTLSLDPKNQRITTKCGRDSKGLPYVTSLVGDDSRRFKNDSSHRAYIYTYSKRQVIKNSDEPTATDYIPEKHQAKLYDSHLFAECQRTHDLPLEITIDDSDRRSYSFNFTMTPRSNLEEGAYTLLITNCLGEGKQQYKMNHRNYQNTRVSFNVSMLIYETNYPENYLSAGLMPLPQMYFMLSVMFFLTGCIWVNFLSKQRESTMKIHKLMAVLVFAKASSLLFHGINYHNIATYGQPVVTWAYLFYATRAIKGALFFITLALIATGWKFVKQILSPRDEKIILVIVVLQVISHVSEIFFDESSEGEARLEFWGLLYTLVDLTCCLAIFLPIAWTERHLREASKTDGKAALNLKKLGIFTKFYILTYLYLYATKILAVSFSISFRTEWLNQFFVEMATFIYYIITGYYFQPVATNPYLLLTSEDMEEDILFSVDAHEMDKVRVDLNDDDSSLLDNEGGGHTKKVRQAIEGIV